MISLLFGNLKYDTNEPMKQKHGKENRLLLLLLSRFSRVQLCATP